MIDTSFTDCSNCIHSNVCSIKEQMKEASKKVVDEFGTASYKFVNVTISCQEFKREVKLRGASF